LEAHAFPAEQHHGANRSNQYHVESGRQDMALINPSVDRFVAAQQSPTAILGSATATALMPVNSSGRDVAVASRTKPIHVRETPVLCEIISP
jgi:hypothetical protein